MAEEFVNKYWELGPLSEPGGSTGSKVSKLQGFKVAKLKGGNTRADPLLTVNSSHNFGRAWRGGLRR
jgi:hypothetical protein